MQIRDQVHQGLPPGNKLSETERLRILDVCNSPEFASLSPNIIVPTLADRGGYIASESTFYRVLKSANQLTRRTRDHRNVPVTSSSQKFSRH